MTISIIGIFVMLLLSMCGVPIAFALFFVGFTGMIVLQGFSVANAVSYLAPLGNIVNGDLSTLPLFILVGSFALASGVAKDGFSFARAWLGRFPGGLGMATITASAFFAACSGSSIAAAVTMGKLSIPEMKSAGYSDSLSTGTAAAGGLLATMIPPSGAFVVYGLASGESIGKLLIAGYIPGIIISTLFMIGIFLQAKLNPSSAPLNPVKLTWKQRFAAIPQVWGIAVIFVTIFVGIFTGIFTASEAAAFGALVALALVIFRMRGKAWKAVVSASYDCAVTTSAIFFLILGAFVFGSFLVLAGLPKTVATTIAASGFPPLAIVAIMIGTYFILGCLMDGVTMMLVTIPIYYPVIIQLGLNGIWFGVIVVAMLEVGMLTPPFGLVAYTINAVAPEVPLTQIFKGSMMFVLLEMIAVVLVMFFPQICLWLPSLMG